MQSSTSPLLSLSLCPSYSHQHVSSPPYPLLRYFFYTSLTNQLLFYLVSPSSPYIILFPSFWHLPYFILFFFSLSVHLLSTSVLLPCSIHSILSSPLHHPPLAASRTTPFFHRTFPLTIRVPHSPLTPLFFHRTLFFFFPVTLTSEYRTSPLATLFPPTHRISLPLPPLPPTRGARRSPSRLLLLFLLLVPVEFFSRKSCSSPTKAVAGSQGPRGRPVWLLFKTSYGEYEK